MKPNPIKTLVAKNLSTNKIKTYVFSKANKISTNIFKYVRIPGTKKNCNVNSSIKNPSVVFEEKTKCVHFY